MHNARHTDRLQVHILKMLKLRESKTKLENIEECDQHQVNVSTSGNFGGACRASIIEVTQYHPVIE